MHPFLDLKNLSDNQLYDKVNELMEYNMVIKSTGGSHAVQQQIEMSMMAVYQEIEERTSLKMSAATEREDPVAWDMDASLTKKRNRADDAESENKKNQKRRWRPSERQRSNRSSK